MRKTRQSIHQHFHRKERVKATHHGVVENMLMRHVGQTQCGLTADSHRLATHYEETKGEEVDTRNAPSPFINEITIRMVVASSRPDHLPTMSAAKNSELSLLAKSHFWWRSGRCRSNFLLQYAGDIEADHTDSGIVKDCAARNRETPHVGD